MKKLLFVMLAFLCMSNSGCENGTQEIKQTYVVIDKDKSVGSHFNIFHEDNFEVGTDYYVTLKNITTGKVFVHKCINAEEYYLYQKGKKYKSSGFREERRVRYE